MFKSKYSKFIALSAALVLVFAVAALAGGNVMAGPQPTQACGVSPLVNVSGLLVKKTVNCAREASWGWTILKSADQSSVTLSEDQILTVNYVVDVDASPLSSSWYVDGVIEIFNTTGAPVTLSSVSDDLAPVSCSLFGNQVTFPYNLNGGTLMTCTYGGTIGSAAANNTVNVVSSLGTATAVAPIYWNQANAVETDECVDVTDSFAGFLGTVCAGTQTSFEFSYGRNIGPYTCGFYTVDNTADFETNDTGATGSSSWTVDVDVPCGGGCTLTPGYWKTHSEYGPAPYDDTWALLPVGADTPFFGTGKSYYQVLWTSASGGNAYIILAHAYIAAQLNVLNEAAIPADVLSAWNQATGLLTAYEGTMNIPKQSADRALAISLAATLDDYNNGLLGPGHCTE